MNVSPSALRENGGSGLSDAHRPSYVSDALEADEKLGYQQGKPLVETVETDEPMRWGDDARDFYDYSRSDDLLLPSAHDFLSELVGHELVGSVDDMVNELPNSVGRRDVRKALELHGIDVPESDEADVRDASNDSDADHVRLPSGEKVPVSVLSEPLYEDKLLLSVLLSDGLSTEEIAHFLKAQPSTERVTESDIRSAAREHNLI